MITVITTAVVAGWWWWWWWWWWYGGSDGGDTTQVQATDTLKYRKYFWRSLVFSGITQHRLAVTDILGLRSSSPKRISS